MTMEGRNGREIIPPDDIVGNINILFSAHSFEAPGNQAQVANIGKVSTFKKGLQFQIFFARQLALGGIEDSSQFSMLTVEELVESAKKYEHNLDLNGLGLGFFNLVKKPAVKDLEDKGLIKREEREGFYKSAAFWFVDIATHIAFSTPSVVNNISSPHPIEIFEENQYPDLELLVCIIEALPFFIASAKESEDHLLKIGRNSLSLDVQDMIGNFFTFTKKVEAAQIDELTKKGDCNISERHKQARKSIKEKLIEAFPELEILHNKVIQAPILNSTTSPSFIS